MFPTEAPLASEQAFGFPYVTLTIHKLACATKLKEHIVQIFANST